MRYIIYGTALLILVATAMGYYADIPGNSPWYTADDLPRQHPGYAAYHDAFSYRQDPAYRNGISRWDRYDDAKSYDRQRRSRHLVVREGTNPFFGFQYVRAYRCTEHGGCQYQNVFIH
jgi:hypothetical protein